MQPFSPHMGKGLAMRKLHILLVLTLISLPAFAAQRLTVDELHSWLAARKASNQSDNDIARAISTLQLIERLTPATLSGFKTEFVPGRKTSQALDLLADCSEFLDPPANEILARPPPDAEALNAMFKATAYFADTTLRRMPDFLATRITQSYDDDNPHAPAPPPNATEDVNLIAPQGEMMHVGTFNQEISIRDGQEVPTKQRRAKKTPSQAPPGFSTRGEFGPVLWMVLLDLGKGKLTWGHWEQTQAGVAAVFHYRIPQSASHFAVDYCCLGADRDRMTWASFRGAGGRPLPSTPGGQLPDAKQINDAYHGTPGYHGSIFIDPASGVILRITLDAEMGPSEPVTRNASAIDYGTVQIGGKEFVCPSRSVAISLTRAYFADKPGLRTILHINRTEFTNYHRFGSTIQIVPSEEAP